MRPFAAARREPRSVDLTSSSLRTRAGTQTSCTRDFLLASLAELIDINNQYHSDIALSISTGIATSRPGDRLEQVVKRADMKMLHAKRLYYLEANRDRREPVAGVNRRRTRVTLAPE